MFLLCACLSIFCDTPTTDQQIRVILGQLDSKSTELEVVLTVSNPGASTYKWQITRLEFQKYQDMASRELLRREGRVDARDLARLTIGLIKAEYVERCTSSELKPQVAKYPTSEDRQTLKILEEEARFAAQSRAIRESLLRQIKPEIIAEWIAKREEQARIEGHRLYDIDIAIFKSKPDALSALQSLSSGTTTLRQRSDSQQKELQAFLGGAIFQIDKGKLTCSDSCKDLMHEDGAIRYFDLYTLSQFIQPDSWIRSVGSQLIGKKNGDLLGPIAVTGPDGEPCYMIVALNGTKPYKIGVGSHSVSLARYMCVQAKMEEVRTRHTQGITVVSGAQ